MHINELGEIKLLKTIRALPGTFEEASLRERYKGLAESQIPI
ncbi:hypothetical protein ACFL4D_01405 [Candidatus Margulisiibacteriota bacterium]